VIASLKGCSPVIRGPKEYILRDKKHDVSVSKGWSNADLKQLLRRKLFLPSLVILKHKIIAAKHAGTTVDDGIIYDLA
jgi:hypothetical protein